VWFAQKLVVQRKLETFFQELADRGTRLGKIAILIAVHFLVLQRFHERLAGGIIVGIAAPKHADGDAGSGAIPLDGLPKDAPLIVSAYLPTRKDRSFYRAMHDPQLLTVLTAHRGFVIAKERTQR
jgi:hypothetical protein